MIDITLFFIIKQEQFEAIIQQFNCNLTINDPSYLATYLFANLMAYIFIYLIIRVVLTLYFEILKRGAF